MVNKSYNAKECYDLGSKAKRLGWMRVAPFYERERASYWWLAGYDAIDFDVAAEKQPEFEVKVFGVPSDEFPTKPIKITPDQARKLGMPIPDGIEAVYVDPSFVSP